ncbi:hypothetical protein [Citrobacter freundii]|uniref:Uncharacterized protein n=1 Tax=Citrobacter freundii TaxID=546 RepID=A0A7G2IZU3_CITFR|nr:hypothetical protein [Citrobacter freundii]
MLPEGGTTQRGCTIVLRRSGQKKVSLPDVENQLEGVTP